MDKRTILAFALMLIVFSAYLWVQEKYFTPAPPQRPTPQATPQPAPAPPSVTQSAPPSPAPVPPPERRTPRPLEQTARVETPLYDAVVSSAGGKLREWTLHY